MAENVTLAGLVKKIADAEVFAKSDPLVGDPRSRIGRETQKRIAETTIADAKLAYAELVKKSAFFIAPEGPSELQQEYAAIAQAEAKTITVDGAAVYKRLAAAIYPSLGGRPTTLSTLQQSLLITETRNMMQDLGITSLPFIHLPSGVTVKTQDQLIDILREAIRKAMGDDLNRIVIFKDLTDEAVKARYTANIVPVVVTGLASDEIKTLATPVMPVFPVKLEEEVTNDSVLKSLAAVRNKLAAFKKK